MTKTERVKAALEGRSPDRIPCCFWTHLSEFDLDPDKLAEHTYAFYRSVDSDLIKTMPNGMYSTEDFGCEIDYSQVPLGGVAKVTRFVVEQPEDWLKLAEPDTGRGALQRELQSLARLQGLLKSEAPVVATVFSPLTTAQKLAGPALVRHMKSDPDKVKAGLAVIAESTRKLALKILELGCAGVFFASQMSSLDNLSEREYAEFGVPYDLAVLNDRAVRGNSWLNVIHIHGNNIMFDLLKDYPVHAVSWHVWETPPSVGEFLEKTKDKCILGGLQRFHITDNACDELGKEIAQTISLTGGKRLILAPGCNIRAPLNMETLHFIRQRIAG